MSDRPPSMPSAHPPTRLRPAEGDSPRPEPAPRHLALRHHAPPLDLPRCLAPSLLALAACATSSPDHPSPTRSQTYTFAPPAEARACAEVERGAASTIAPGEPAGCTSYRALVAPGTQGPATVDDLDALRELCASGVLDACDHGLLLVAICSEQEIPADPACVHLARRGELPPPEPAWRDVAIPPAWVGCFELLPAPGPHARDLAPGGVFCLSSEGVLATRSPPADPAAGADANQIDALRVAALGLRRVERRGLAVHELPFDTIDLVPVDGIDAHHRAGVDGGPASPASVVRPVIASLLPGPRVKTSHAVMPARRLAPGELARIAPGLDRPPLEATCARARDCLVRASAAEAARGAASGLGWDGAPPEVPSSLRGCAAVVATCER